MKSLMATDDGKCPLGHLELVCIRRRPMKGGGRGERARGGQIVTRPGELRGAKMALKSFKMRVGSG